MGEPFMIQSANGALTIDISHATYTDGTGILGYPTHRGTQGLTGSLGADSVVMQ
jgi:hypothetical protein